MLMFVPPAENAWGNCLYGWNSKSFVVTEIITTRGGLFVEIENSRSNLEMSFRRREGK